jgi:hypothetical protein
LPDIHVRKGRSAHLTAPERIDNGLVAPGIISAAVTEHENMRQVIIALLVVAFAWSHPVASSSIVEAIAPTGRLGLSSGASISREHAPGQPKTWAASAAAVRYIPFLEAKPLFAALPKTFLPAELAEAHGEARETSWAQWVSRRDAEIRARLLQGDDDSIVNLLFFGTTFTTERRAATTDIARLAGPQPFLGGLARRIDDMVDGILSPGANERLIFARTVIERHDIHPDSPGARARIHALLTEMTLRVAREWSAYERAMLQTGPTAFASQSTLFHQRGLSSDTSIFPGFGIEEALKSLAGSGGLRQSGIRRVAIVGPGLEFVDKDFGYDFYPQQTLQPFALIDSLARLGLADVNDLRTTTFDVNPRINRHLEAARRRAWDARQPYVIQLPLDRGLRWNPGLAEYWKRFGDRIGQQAGALGVPAGIGPVQLRGVRVPPAIVSSIQAEDLNIVLQRLEPLSAEQRFDLVVATNVLAYYDEFEQLLALTNIANMLAPGGWLLANGAFPRSAIAHMELAGYTNVTYLEGRHGGDRLVWYRRQ